MTQTKAELLQTRHQGDIRLGDADSTHYVGFKAPATVSSSLVWTLPAADGSSNQFLKTDGSGNLSWATDSATDSTKLPLAGGTMSGDINLGTNDITNGGTITGTFSGNLTGNVTGNASGTAATVTGAAQSAITSLGTLTGLTINGGLSLTGANYDAAWVKSADTFRLQDNTILGFGASDDLKIYHDGSHSRLVEAGTGYLKVQSGQVAILNADDSEQMAQFYADGAVELYHNNSKKIETTSGGVNVTGEIQVNGAALAGGGFASVQFFTSSGTWTKPSGIKIIRVTVIGGGGGGARSNTVYDYGGNGGGAGGFSQKIIDVTSISSETVTIGAGGNGYSWFSSGGTGGASSFGSHCSASGGSGGANPNGNGSSTATTAGVGSSGNINLRGGYGSVGTRGQNKAVAGTGGNSVMWGAVNPGGLATGGNAQTTYGSGGGGAATGTSTTGGSGLVVVEEFK